MGIQITLAPAFLKEKEHREWGFSLRYVKSNRKITERTRNHKVINTGNRF
jgi:hypothetical protein